MCDNPGCQHVSAEQTRATLESRIAEYGWTVVGVLESRDATPFSYTVGLTLKDQPELLVEGDPKTMNALVTALAELATTNPDLFKPDEHVAVTVHGQVIEIHLAGPTKANYRRAIHARALYSATHRVRVLQAIPV